VEKYNEFLVNPEEFNYLELSGGRMTRTDPFTPEESYYECLECGSRTLTEDHIGSCPACGGEVRNIGVPRE
jgi:rubrerythrin